MAVEESRPGIPLLVDRGVIHDFKTIFPIPLGQAVSFNPQLVKAGYDRNMRLTAEPGEFHAWIGGSSEAHLRTRFTLVSP